MARFSILNVPKHRRLQTAAVVLANWPTTLLAGLALTGLCLWAGGALRYFTLAYIAFILLLDSGAGRGAEGPQSRHLVVLW